MILPIKAGGQAWKSPSQVRDTIQGVTQVTHTKDGRTGTLTGRGGWLQVEVNWDSGVVELVKDGLVRVEDTVEILQLPQSLSLQKPLRPGIMGQ